MGANSYTAKVLWVDLTQSKIDIRDLDEESIRKYVGGVGLASIILWDGTTKYTEPLSLENPLVFMVGPLTGTRVPMNSRYSVAAISPLAGTWGEAHSGGAWPYQLRHAGFIGIVFEGKSEKPVYLWINNGEAVLRDASHLWGKGTFETSDIVQAETDKRASVVCIGPAGEKLVKIACIMNEGKVGRAAARSGLGAVMGSKNLKAVAVRGTFPVEVHDRERLSDNVKKFNATAHDGISKWHTGEAGSQRIARIHQKGRLPIRNFCGGDFPGFLEKFIEVLLQGEKYYCPTCQRSHSECRLVEGRRRVSWEAMGPLGSQCLIDDMKALQEAEDICQDFGMDTISTGGVMSFAIEAFEKRLINEADTGGISLTWGNAQALLQMVNRIARRQGFGEILGEGVKKAAEHIGGIAPEYAMHVKGLSFPAHDPRASHSLALEYATGNRGADHMSAGAVWEFVDAPELGWGPEHDLKENRFKIESHVESVAAGQNYMCLFDSLVLCKLMIPQPFGPRPADIVQWVNLVTGWDTDIKELLKTGERIFNLKRLFNVRRGTSRKDDMLPPRVLTHRLGGSSEAAENLPPLGELLNRYYLYRGWSEEGTPTEEKLAELGLSAP